MGSGAQLVLRPLLHLIRFHGVLALNDRLRARVVPQGPADEQQRADAAVVDECEAGQTQGRPHRIGWAWLLRHVFDIDMQHCPHCDGWELRIVAAILKRPLIEKILTHLGLDPQPPHQGPGARGEATVACLSCAGRRQHNVPGSNADRSRGGHARHGGACPQDAGSTPRSRQRPALLRRHRPAELDPSEVTGTKR